MRLSKRPTTLKQTEGETSMTTLNKQSILYKTLARALSMMRPHNSEGTRRLTDWLQERANKLPNAMVGRDAAGNLHVDTRMTKDHRTLFVAHVDTVHRKEGPNKIKQTSTHWYADGAALGADDGAGVAMLMHLLHAGVHAYYVFTQGEECGGIGLSSTGLSRLTAGVSTASSRTKVVGVAALMCLQMRSVMHSTLT
jgi:di/tripeptidase